MAIFTGAGVAIVTPMNADGTVNKNVLYSYAGANKNPVVPSSVKEIGSYAFSNCKELKTVNFNSYPQNLGNNSFYNCGIEYLTISSGSTGEVVSAFDGCYNIKEYDVPTLEGYTSQTILFSNNVICQNVELTLLPSNFVLKTFINSSNFIF